MALSATQVFNVNHHKSDLEVTCHNQIDASFCWPTADQGRHRRCPPVRHPGGSGPRAEPGDRTPVRLRRGDPGGHGGRGVHRHHPAGRRAGHEPVLRIHPAVRRRATRRSGSTPASPRRNWSDPTGTRSTRWPASDPGTQNTMLCFDLATDAACAAQPYTVFPPALTRCRSPSRPAWARPVPTCSPRSPTPRRTGSPASTP